MYEEMENMWKYVVCLPLSSFFPTVFTFFPYFPTCLKIFFSVIFMLFLLFCFHLFPTHSFSCLNFPRYFVPVVFFPVFHFPSYLQPFLYHNLHLQLSFHYFPVIVFLSSCFPILFIFVYHTFLHLQFFPCSFVPVVFLPLSSPSPYNSSLSSMSLQYLPTHQYINTFLSPSFFILTQMISAGISKFLQTTMQQYLHLFSPPSSFQCRVGRDEQANNIRTTL